MSLTTNLFYNWRRYSFPMYYISSPVCESARARKRTCYHLNIYVLLQEKRLIEAVKARAEAQKKLWVADQEKEQAAAQVAEQEKARVAAHEKARTAALEKALASARAMAQSEVEEKVLTKAEETAQAQAKKNARAEAERKDRAENASELKCACKDQCTVA
jgi:hypothetical protein